MLHSSKDNQTENVEENQELKNLFLTNSKVIFHQVKRTVSSVMTPGMELLSCYHVAMPKLAKLALIELSKNLNIVQCVEAMSQNIKRSLTKIVVLEPFFQ